MLIDDILLGFKALITDESDAKAYSQTVPEFTQKIMASSRFSLSDNVTLAVTNLVATKPSNLSKYLEFARRPFKNLWIDFSAQPRLNCLANLGIEPAGQQPSRVGFYIDDHPDFPDESLCGRAIIGWRHHGFAIGETAYSELRWDLRDNWTDWRTKEEIEKQESLAGQKKTSVLWNYRMAKTEITEHCRLMSRFLLHPAWIHEAWLYKLYCESPKAAEKLITESQSDATSEAIMILATLILFNTRRALTYQPTSNTKINKARQRQGKPQLLDYQTVNFYLSKAKQRSYTAKGMSVQQGMVLQRVIGYFQSRYSAKRGTNELYWIEPYTRGDAQYGLGKSITHTKTVRL